MSEGLHPLTKKIKSGQRLAGTCVTFADPAVSEMLAMTGLDILWIDMEHTSLDKRDVQLHLMAIRGTGASALVRVAWNDPVLVKPLLDMGADGIVFPFVRTAEDARLAVRSCLYPPQGVRGFGPVAAARYGMTDNKKYIEASGKNIWKVIQIEHVDAVDNLEQIVAVDGVDAILVGPNDLSASAGRIGQYDHPEVVRLFDRIAAIARNSHIPFGVATYGETAVNNWLQRGVDWIILGTDFLFMRDKALASLQSFRESEFPG